VPGQSLRVEIDVTNTGDRRGSEVVQCYVAPINPRLFRPVKELKAFAKVNLEPGEQTTVTLELGDRDFAYFDPGDPAFYALGPGFMTPSTERRRPESGWFVDPGSYELHIGRSSAEISAVVPIVVTAPADGVRLAGA
jgi:beta-glucosidase